MKPFLLLFLAALASAPQSFSQDEETATFARTFIPDALHIPIFTPPPPADPKRLPNIRIDCAVVVPSESGNTLTLQRGAASTLPDLPPQPPSAIAKPPCELTAEDRESNTYERKHNFNISATVYDHKVSQVQWTDQDTGISYQAVCGFDIGLLAGVGTFVRDGETYSIFLMHSDFDTTEIRRLSQKYLPSIPEIAPGHIFITDGDAKNPNATAPLQIMRELIVTEKGRLLDYQSARVQQKRQAEAWGKAHPAVPRDEIFVLRPHRGSRYLADPQPEKTEDAR